MVERCDTECTCDRRRVLVLTGKKGTERLEEVVEDMKGCCFSDDSETMSLQNFYDSNLPELNLKQYDYVMVGYGLAKSLHNFQP
ncbi:hypothetical protein HYT23_01915 [Candidatus Pacearchaeota archaeon]|nr:hypothetical protein [Candidatus Pacearchaeota archaeon]